MASIRTTHATLLIITPNPAHRSVTSLDAASGNKPGQHDKAARRIPKLTVVLLGGNPIQRLHQCAGMTGHSEDHHASRKSGRTLGMLSFCPGSHRRHVAAAPAGGFGRRFVSNCNVSGSPLIRIPTNSGLERFTCLARISLSQPITTGDCRRSAAHRAHWGTKLLLTSVPAP